MLGKDYVYLDHNATSVIRPQVVAKMMDCYGASYNPSSIHEGGRKARSMIDDSRSIIAQHIDCEKECVFFTSGGTESNNIVLQGGGWDRVFCSTTEHDSVYRGPVTDYIPVLSSGLLNLDCLEQLLKSTEGKKTLVSVHWANNETGIIQPIAEIGRLVHLYGAFLHVDGVQALGKIPVSFSKNQIDFLSLSAHKIGGPQGTGALVVKPDKILSPLFFGGGQEKFLRPGTENVAGILGFAEAIKHLDFSFFCHLRSLHDRLEDELCVLGEQHNRVPIIVGKGQDRLPNTTCLSMPGVSNQSQLIYFDLKKIGVSIGSACASATVKPSHVLQNMGFGQDVIGSSVRISSGWTTTENDLEKFKDAWKEMFLKHL